MTTTIEPISRRRANVTVGVAARNGRRSSLGRRNEFEYDGTTVRVYARNSGEVLYEQPVTEARWTGRESWRFEAENGDVVLVVVGCNCGSR